MQLRLSISLTTSKSFSCILRNVTQSHPYPQWLRLLVIFFCKSPFQKYTFASPSEIPLKLPISCASLQVLHHYQLPTWCCCRECRGQASGLVVGDGGNDEEATLYLQWGHFKLLSSSYPISGNSSFVFCPFFFQKRKKLLPGVLCRFCNWVEKAFLM